MKVAFSSNSSGTICRFISYLSISYTLVETDRKIESDLITVILTVKEKIPVYTQILCALEKKTGISAISSNNHTRKTREIVDVRRVACFLLRDRLGLTFLEIGNILKINHATAILANRYFDGFRIGADTPIEKAIRLALSYVADKRIKKRATRV